MSWQDCTLGDVVKLQRGHDLPERVRADGPVPIVSSSGITGRHNVAKAEPPGVVTGRYGTIGQVFFIDEPYWPLNTSLYVVDFKGNDPRFAAYLLRNTLKNYQSEKAAVPGVDRKVLHLLKVRAPDLQLQERIVSIISAYDDLIENNRRRMALLEEAARLLYREWFVHFRFPGHEHVKITGGLPEGWKFAGIGQTTWAFFDGPHATPAPADEGPVFLGIKNIRETGGLDLSDIRHVSEADFPRWTRRVTPREGDIVFSYEATLNRYALIPRGLRCCLGRRMALIRPKDEYRLFLFLHMFSEDWRRVIAARVISGATVDRLPLKTFPGFPVLLPPPRVAISFGEAVEPQFRMLETLMEQSQKLAQARDLLLPRLMSGELAV